MDPYHERHSFAELRLFWGLSEWLFIEDSEILEFLEWGFVVFGKCFLLSDDRREGQGVFAKVD